MDNGILVEYVLIFKITLPKLEFTTAHSSYHCTNGQCYPPILGPVKYKASLLVAQTTLSTLHGVGFGSGTKIGILPV